MMRNERHSVPANRPALDRRGHPPRRLGPRRGNAIRVETGTANWHRGHRPIQEPVPRAIRQASGQSPSRTGSGFKASIRWRSRALPPYPARCTVTSGRSRPWQAATGSDKHVARLITQQALVAGLRPDLPLERPTLPFVGTLRFSAVLPRSRRAARKALGHAWAEMTPCSQPRRDRFRVDRTGPRACGGHPSRERPSGSDGHARRG